MFGKMIGGRARFAAIGAVVVVVGGVACSALGSELAARSSGGAAPAATTAPAAQNGKVAQPAAIPAASPPLVAGGAPAAAIASDASVRSAPAANAAQAASSAQTANGAGSPNTLPDTSAQLLDRMVIRTAQLTVEVTSMEQTLAKVRQIASRDGGFVSASNTHVERVNDQDRTVADLTVQVRSSSADSTLSDLRALGNVTSESSGSQDVTEEYVDLDSNLRNLQASESAILKLMDKATQIQDVLALQRELTNVRGQIERIQGRKTYLERRSDMATITLALRLPPVESARPLTGGGWDPVAVAQRGWQASLALLRGVAEVVIVAAAFSWWLVPFVALGAYVWLHRRRTPPPAPASAPADA
jgi:uncharacterized protein DUF4349